MYCLNFEYLLFVTHDWDKVPSRNIRHDFRRQTLLYMKRSGIGGIRSKICCKISIVWTSHLTIENTDSIFSIMTADITLASKHGLKSTYFNKLLWYPSSETISYESCSVSSCFVIFLYCFSFCFTKIKCFCSDPALLLSGKSSASVSDEDSSLHHTFVFFDRTSSHLRIPCFWLSATKMHAPKSSYLLRTRWLHFEQGLPSCLLRNTHKLIADIPRYVTTAGPLHYSRTWATPTVNQARETARLAGRLLYS